MSEKLIIRNFGPIKDVELDIKKFNVFIGQQASGKSTVAKVLAIFRRLDFHEAESKRKHFSDFGISNYIKDSTFFDYTSEDFSVSFNNGEWVISQTESFKEKLRKEKSGIELLFRGIIESDPKYKDQSQQSREELLVSVVDSAWKTLAKVPRKQNYIPAERILVSIINNAPASVTSLGIPTFLTEFLISFENARKEIKEFMIDFLNFTYKFEDNENRIYHQDSNSVLLSESASGIQSSLPMSIVIKFLNTKKRSGCFIVEEPELNLFPSAQKDIIEFLVKETNFVGLENELIITTHSPYVLSVMNNLLMAFQTAKKKPDHLSEVVDVVSEKLHINPENFCAYYFSGGTCTSIFNRKTGLISQNELDDISEDLGGEFDELMDIYKGK